MEKVRELMSRVSYGANSMQRNCKMKMLLLPAGEYIVCKIEAESFEELVTTVLNQANKYLFETWLPNRNLVTKPFMAEKYYKGNAEISYMEVWVIPVETVNAKKELSDKEIAYYVARKVKDVACKRYVEVLKQKSNFGRGDFCFFIGCNQT